jgi:hypothetical protein
LKGCSSQIESVIAATRRRSYPSTGAGISLEALALAGPTSRANPGKWREMLRLHEVHKHLPGAGLGALNSAREIRLRSGFPARDVREQRADAADKTFRNLLEQVLLFITRISV